MRAGMAPRGWQPEWYVLERPRTKAPAWLLAGSPYRDPTWWRGILGYLYPVLHICSEVAEPKVRKFESGQGIAAHPTQPALLHSVCLLPRSYRSLVNGSSTWKFKGVSRGGGYYPSRSMKAGYLKVKESGFAPGLPAQEIYLQQLLCFMFWGPCPQPGLGACHVCENSLCVAPWHLVWGSQEVNSRGYHVHRRHRARYYDPAGD
jgi:hypothetical protein